MFNTRPKSTTDRCIVFVDERAKTARLPHRFPVSQTSHAAYIIITGITTILVYGKKMSGIPAVRYRFFLFYRPAQNLYDLR